MARRSGWPRDLGVALRVRSAGTATPAPPATLRGLRPRRLQPGSPGFVPTLCALGGGGGRGNLAQPENSGSVQGLAFPCRLLLPLFFCFWLLFPPFSRLILLRFLTVPRVRSASLSFSLPPAALASAEHPKRPAHVAWERLPGTRLGACHTGGVGHKMPAGDCGGFGWGMARWVSPAIHFGSLSRQEPYRRPSQTHPFHR